MKPSPQTPGMRRLPPAFSLTSRLAYSAIALAFLLVISRWQHLSLRELQRTWRCSDLHERSPTAWHVHVIGPNGEAVFTLNLGQSALLSYYANTAALARSPRPSPDCRGALFPPSGLLPQHWSRLHATYLTPTSPAGRCAALFARSAMATTPHATAAHYDPTMRRRTRGRTQQWDRIPRMSRPVWREGLAGATPSDLAADRNVEQPDQCSGCDLYAQSRRRSLFSRQLLQARVRIDPHGWPSLHWEKPVAMTLLVAAPTDRSLAALGMAARMRCPAAQGSGGLPAHAGEGAPLPGRACCNRAANIPRSGAIQFCRYSSDSPHAPLSKSYSGVQRARC